MNLFKGNNKDTKATSVTSGYFIKIATMSVTLHCSNIYNNRFNTPSQFSKYLVISM